MAERAIIDATITIQRFARGFITRIKVRSVQLLAAQLERAHLNEMLGSMQATVKDFAKHSQITPAKFMSPIKEFATEEKESQYVPTNKKQDIS